MKLSKEQQVYSIAESEMKALDYLSRKAEKEYIKKAGIKNKSGEAPLRIWTIDDEKAFDYHNERLGKIMEESGFDEKYTNARNRLRKAEDDLIAFGLSLVPANIRGILAEGARTNYCTREKILDAAFRLDVSTVSTAA